MKKAALTLTCAGALLFVPTSAQAEITSVFADTATPVDCTVQSGGATDGVRFCSENPRSTVATFDGVPIDVNVAFPPEPESDPDGPWPVVMMFHGYGGTKIGLNSMNRWLQQGYATFSMTTRGFGQSCGNQAARDALGAACDDGYVRLMDTRYEVRDAQELIALLVDEGLVDGDRMGATGGSYGGGTSMALAALKDRQMLPDGSYVDWESPDGAPLSLAAAAPEIPWTDLSYSLVPNGGNLDYISDASYFAANDRVGVPKEGWVDTLYLGGFLAGFYAPDGTDPDADLPGWRQRLLFEAGGLDDDPEVADIVDEISTHHSSYGIDDSTAPAPLMISSGWTDDLFPANEALRYYNRLKAHHPTSPIALNFADFGHPRGQNKPAATGAIATAENAWFAHYVRGDGAAPPQQVQAFTQTCPNAAAPGGPFTAPTPRELAPGEIRFESDGVENIATTGTEHGLTFGSTQSVGGSFATACVTTAATDTEATANYRLDPAPAGGYTLMGSPTVRARFALAGQDSQLAARLLDVGIDGQQTLVARGLWRPEVTGKERVRQVFQLNPNGYHFAEGHIAKLEIAPSDRPFGLETPQGKASIDHLRLTLPVLQTPGSLGGLVQEQGPKPLPWAEGRDVRLAPDYDDGPPRTFITKGPGKKTNKRNVTFDWEWSDIGSTLECSLDGADFSACVGPLPVTGLSKGKHTFQVRAVDPEHLVDPSPATRKFTVK